MRRPRVLVACGDPEEGKGLAGRLEALGYGALPPLGASGEVLSELEETRPDLLLLDRGLPGDLAAPALARMVEERFDLPVVFLGTEGDPEEDSEESDPYGFLSRPVRDRDLSAALLMALHRRHLEERIREEQRRLQALLENLRTGVLVFRREPEGVFRLREINGSAERIEGTRREDLLGRTPEEFLPEAMPWLGDRLDRAARTGRSDPFSVPLRRRDEEIRWLEGTFFALSGQEVGVIWRDVGKARRLEETLRRQTHELSERLTESRVLGETGRLLQEPFLSFDERLCRSVELIPRAFRRGEDLEARILLEGREYETRHFLQTPWGTSQGVFVEGRLEGAVEVCYRSLAGADQEGLFLREEIDFLRTLASLVSEALVRERRTLRGEQALRLALRCLETCAVGPVVLLDPEGRILEGDGQEEFLPGAFRRFQGRPLEEAAERLEGDLPGPRCGTSGTARLRPRGSGVSWRVSWTRIPLSKEEEPCGFLLRLESSEGR